MFPCDWWTQIIHTLWKRKQLCYKAAFLETKSTSDQNLQATMVQPSNCLHWKTKSICLAILRTPPPTHTHRSTSFNLQIPDNTGHKLSKPGWHVIVSGRGLKIPQSGLVASSWVQRGSPGSITLKQPWGWRSCFLSLSPFLHRDEKSTHFTKLYKA